MPLLWGGPGDSTPGRHTCYYNILSEVSLWKEAVLLFILIMAVVQLSVFCSKLRGAIVV